MNPEFIYFLRTAIQILSICFVILTLQDNEKLLLPKISVIFISTYTINLILELNAINQTYTFMLMTFITIVFISVLFWKNWIDSCIDYSVFLVAGFPLSFLTELIILALSLLGINLDVDKNEYHKLIYMVITLIFTIIVFTKIPFKKLLDKYHNLLRKFILIIANMFIFYFIIKEYSVVNSSHTLIIPFTYISLIILNIFIFKEFWNTKINEKLMQQHNDHIKNIEPLILDIRGKQHDFKNHIMTLKSLYEHSDNSNSDSTIDTYISTINKDLSEIDYFIYSCNKVIGVILYLKSLECNNKNIDFCYFHPSYELSFPFEDFEFSSILGNLIDNAIEATEAWGLKEKKVSVVLNDTNEEKYIEVSNTGNPIPFSLIPNLFSRGYTSKQNKKNHGFGLYNVKKIVTKYQGKISVENNDSFVIFKISFPTK